MRQVCSTTEVPEQDRLAHWVDAICGAFIHVDCELTRNCQLSGEIIINLIGEVRVGRVKSMAQRITRSARQIARKPTDVFDLGIQQSGYDLMHQGDQQIMLSRGAFVLHDNTRPWQLAFDGDFAQLVLQIPRAALLRRLGSAEDLCGLRIDGTTSLGGMLPPLIEDLSAWLDTVSCNIRLRLGESLLDFVATALLAHGDRAQVSVASATLPGSNCGLRAIWPKTWLLSALHLNVVSRFDTSIAFLSAKGTR